MACGCAVITTDSGGVHQFAKNGENCLMTSPDDPPALARAIQALVGDPDRRCKLADAGLRTAQDYNQGAVLERFCRYLIDLAPSTR
jgi:glycosyltransferase involved in cell wall biosynthesis